ncbi:MAG: lipoyl synthase [Acidobacteria bacterium]|nr:lipoyl synthase [Acidobacteriota bacterium]
MGAGPILRNPARPGRRPGSGQTRRPPGRLEAGRRLRAVRYNDVVTTAPLEFIRPREPKPDWLKVKAPGSEGYLRLKALMKDLGLHTVCEEARCPNIGECWHHGTATFMILGEVCTRACAYCAVAHGRPAPLDEAEPARVADAVARMGLRHAVITSVDRDDVPDGGAGIFADTIRRIRADVPSCRIEVLIPDFQGAEAPLRTVLEAGPHVLNHNIETVPRLYRMARSGGRYPRSLELLDRARTWYPGIPTKTGLMVGLGEEPDELVAVFDDLARVGVSILTIGQYLRPTPAHAPMARYYEPAEFAALRDLALARGFTHVESGPLVRSSYHAHEQADAHVRESSRRPSAG